MLKERRRKNHYQDNATGAFNLCDYVIIPWMQSNNPQERKFEICMVESAETYDGGVAIVYHVPKIKFGFLHKTYLAPIAID
jgi:hypothetical protein